MLGDTAVAVNPEDTRYKHLTGKKIKLPLTDHVIPIIEDSIVDKEFGTGAVKVTPEHDLVDYEIAERHSLPHRTVINKDGRMTNDAGTAYAGMKLKECRDKVVEDLKSAGLLEKIEPYKNSIAKCYRCATNIEPLVSEQWFVKMQSIAQPAITAIKDGKVRFYPESWKEPCLTWLENLKDWCISRQIWWGHRIPIWYCQNCNNIMVSIEPITVCANCSGKNVTQDPDVLDTWFSSALWPFSVFGWPDNNEDIKYYYPTSVLITGYEILYLWVARMIMMGLKFKNDVPYTNVYLHGIVRDIHGKKMSKSLGNVIDPLEIMDKYGTDALRFSLIMSAAAGRDIQLAEESFLSARNFCNKIWNATRFIFMNVQTKEVPALAKVELTNIDKWILAEFNDTIKSVTQSMNEYQLHESARLLYDFFWAKFCDWYLEFIKPALKSGENMAQVAVPIHIMVDFLKLLHPISPYITEEIYQQIKSATNVPLDESIMISNWPDLKLDTDNDEYKTSRKETEFLIKLITDIRLIRTDMNILPKQLIELVINCQDTVKQELLNKYLPNLRLMVKVDKITFAADKPAHSISGVILWPDTQAADMHIPLKDVIDIDKEKQRIEKTKEKLNGDMANLQRKLSDQNFITRAPKQEIDRLNTYLEQTKNKLSKIEELINQL
jgi:valyl-tRNA synthetase